MKEVNCKYSVEIYDYYSDDNSYYIVMEKCDGDLKELLEKNKGFQESKIKKILLELNEAFKVMNFKNIVHRDLKPENIFIKYQSNNNDFIIKLDDFGLSRKYEYQNQQFSSNQGTFGYAAPEMSEPKYDPSKCDLWAIGVIIYVLKFNYLPWGQLYSGIIPNKFDDKNLNDLVSKLIVTKQSERINWEDYYNHPYFK